MKYSVPFYQKFKYLDKIDEVTIKFKNENYKLIEFLKKNTDKTVVIEIPEPEKTFTDDWLAFIREVSNQFKIKIKYDYKVFNPEKLIDLEIPFFFSNFIDSWDVLNGIANYNPTDIYITNELGFDLVHVSEFLHRKNILIRVFPNIAQSKFNKLDSILKFFIRPEDAHHYEGYVDVLEFIGNVNQINVAYDTYVNKKYWFGPVKEDILLFKNDDFSYTDTLDNRMIDPNFGLVRIGCEKKCMKNKTCSTCFSIIATAEVLRENKMMIKNKSGEN